MLTRENLCFLEKVQREFDQFNGLLYAALVNNDLHNVLICFSHANEKEATVFTFFFDIRCSVLSHVLITELCFKR